MFLNWVYRRVTDSISDPTVGSPCAGPAEIGAWQGFRNIDGNGAFDSSLPGNARYWWLEAQMQAIFTEHNWQ